MTLGNCASLGDRRGGTKAARRGERRRVGGGSGEGGTKGEGGTEGGNSNGGGGEEGEENRLSEHDEKSLANLTFLRRALWGAGGGSVTGSGCSRLENILYSKKNILYSRSD